MHTFEDLREIIEQEIASQPYDQRKPDGLFQPISYILRLGGKRVRPTLACIACEMFGGDYKPALEVAMAIETYHNFTLLHDDLMDKSSMRRGKETVHHRWGDNTAILSGDAMTVAAYEHLARVNSRLLPVLLPLFNRMAMEICQGQQYDMDFERRDFVAEDEYLEMIRLKTAVLLATALKMGAIAGGADIEKADILYRYGIHIGLSFQLEDDLLDVYGDPIILGKKIGDDIACNKKTMLLIKALEMAQGEELNLLRESLLMPDVQCEEKIRAVTGIYNRLGIRPIVEDLIDYHNGLAEKALDELGLDEITTKPLRELIGTLRNRKS